MQLATIPLKISTIWGTNGAAYRRAIPNASQIGKVNGAASYSDGFVPLNFTPVAAGGVPPFGQDMNGVLFQMTGWERWAQAGGAILYDAQFQQAVGGYPSRARVGSVTTPYLIWQSTADNNLTNPDTGGAGWQPPIFPDVGNAGLTVTAPTTVAAPIVFGQQGANIRLVGNGTIAPIKWLRAFNGNFAIVNNAYNAEIFTLSDAGDVSNIRNLNAVGALTVGGSAGISGNVGVGGALSVTGTATINVSMLVGNGSLPAAGYVYVEKGLESGGTLKVDSFCQFAGPVNVGGVNSGVYFTDSVNVASNLRGYIRRKFSTAPDRNDPTTDTLILNAWANQSNPDANTNVVTIDIYGGLTAAGDIVCGFHGSPTGNNSVIRFRDASGTNQGFMYRDNTLGNIVICANNPAGGPGTPGLGIVIHGNGDLQVSGHVSAANISLLEDAVAGLTTRLATLEARA